jgi:GDP/UDP-N,N'-diacetylbacillosamine 2-epimerase (hydrolysing)
MGLTIRDEILNFARTRKNVYTIESFGTLGYFSCISLCKFLIGNSSSGIIEASSFKKYVINLGDRQNGREASGNVFNCRIDRFKILEMILNINKLDAWSGNNIYGDGNSANKIIDILKTRI